MNHPPRKTDLGRQELKLRTRKLGQRYRTVLLLVDGRRSLGEILGLAQQTGVAVSYFEELVALGMVDLIGSDGPVSDSAPLDSAPMPLAPDSRPAPLDRPDPVAPAAAVADAAEDAVAADPSASSAFADLDEPAPEPAPEPVFVGSAMQPLDAEPDPRSSAEPELVMTETVLEVLPPAGPMPADTIEPISLAPPVAVLVSDEPTPRPARRLRADADLLAGLDADALPMGDSLAAPDAGLPIDPGEPAAPDDGPEASLHAEVRSLLISSLLIDGPVSGSLTALRVRRARSHDELIRLVWEIERSMVRARRPAEAQRRLTRARDLLGLGNTVVHGDSWIGSPGP